MSYLVKEIFYSLQGEGFHAGRPAVFCRFSGCNLWSGREEDRRRSICQFCDTEFLGTDGPAGGKYETAEELVRKIVQLWPSKGSRATRPFVVLTGGEPLLQLDDELIDFLHRENVFIAVETNGTVLPPAGIDWLCVSPKAGAKLVLCCGEELKLVFPQNCAGPEAFAFLDFKYFFLQPCAGIDIVSNTKLAVEYVLAHPQWHLSLQIQKILKIK